MYHTMKGHPVLDPNRVRSGASVGVGDDGPRREPLVHLLSTRVGQGARSTSSWSEF